MRLVFTNTFTYNQPGSDIVVMASTLSSLFNEKFEILKAKIEERGRDAPEGVEETLKELRDSMSSVQRELERIKKTPNGRAGRAGAAEDQRPMTFEEKKKLSHAINNLPSDNLGMVVKIIHERMPQLTSSGEEIEIDIDALNPATLRHLERYVRSVTQRGRRRGSRTPSLTSSTSSSNNVQNEPLAPQGTQQKIEDVERQIKALTEHQQALTQKGLARSSGETDLLLAAAEEKKKKRNNDDSDSSESETDGSDSSDSSDSETSDSESDSGSDSESTDSEAERKDAAAAAPAATPVVTTLPSDASAAGESSSETADATTAVVAGEVAAASAPSPATASAGEGTRKAACSSREVFAFAPCDSRVLTPLHTHTQMKARTQRTGSGRTRRAQPYRFPSTLRWAPRNHRSSLQRLGTETRAYRRLLLLSTTRLPSLKRQRCSSLADY